MSTVNVFTYGSLMFAPVWEMICTERYETQAMVLKGYRRFRVRGESYPAVVAHDGATVQGLVYLNVSLADQQRLDQFECDEYVVQRQQIDGLSVAFYEYVAINRIDRRDWDPVEFEKKDLPAFLNQHVSNFLKNGSRTGLD